MHPSHDITLGDLFRAAGCAWHPAAPGVERIPIRDVVEDSREATPGALFLARPGTKTDGASFIADARGRGATAVALPLGSVAPTDLPTAFLESPASDGPRLAEAFHGWPSRSLRLFGVTGTNGKTTTAFLVHQILAAASIRAGLLSTVLIDDGRHRRTARLTTPSAVEISRAFAAMRAHGCTAAAMEVSSHALDQGRIAALRFDVAAFTNLSGDHLDYHGTLENYAAAKALLFERLDARALAIVNADDPAADRMLRGCRARVLRISLGGAGAARADVLATLIESSLRGLRATLRTPWGPLDLNAPLIGPHNLWNLTLALCAAIDLGVPLSDAPRAIATLAAPPGRLEPVPAPEPHPGFAVFVDYAHTDDAISRVLAAVRPLVPPGGRLRILFGCGGDRDRTKRPRMAAAAFAGADDVFLTSDNPRTEDPRAIIADALAGIPAADHHRVHVDPDRESSIRAAIAACRPGDILVIAGKGHETYQLLPDGRGGIVRRDFDDRAVAADALASRLQSASAGRISPAHGEVTA